MPGGSEIKAFATKPDYLQEKKKNNFHGLSLDDHINAMYTSTTNPNPISSMHKKVAILK